MDQLDGDSHTILKIKMFLHASHFLIAGRRIENPGIDKPRGHLRGLVLRCGGRVGKFGRDEMAREITGSPLLEEN